jgi:hypothetical protein
MVPTIASAGAGCEDEARRVEQGSTYLPDCRAYELVTPPGSANPVAPEFLLPYEQEGHSVGQLEGAGEVRAAVTGDRIAYGSNDASAQSLGHIYLATRGGEGWSTASVIPPQSVQNSICGWGPVTPDWSTDLSRGVLLDGYESLLKGGEPVDCGRDEPALVPGEPKAPFMNLFVRDSGSGGYQLVNVTPSTVAPANALFDGASADLGLIVFTESARLTANAPSGAQMYEWSAGKVYLVTILPGGATAQGQLAGAILESEGFHLQAPVQPGDFSHAVSADGSRVFFEAGGNLYVRENGAQEPTGECAGPASPCTVQIDASQGTGAGGGGAFKWASADGSRVFFTDESRLTANATAEPGKPDLYECEVSEAGGHSRCNLTDLTVNVSEPAHVLGVSGASEDGTYVYFIADGVLAGTEENGHHAAAIAGRPNLYIRHGGVTTFIATLDAATNDLCDWNAQCLTARVSSNGLFIAFDSIASLTGYDNTPADPQACAFVTKPGSPCTEVFLYGAGDHELSCASCDPSGAPAPGPATIRLPSGTEFFLAKNLYLSRNVSDSGQVFFDTANAFTPGSTAELKGNVYEYGGGQLHLISGGASDHASYFMDATPNGSDVFFVTTQALLPEDTSAAYVMYDARVGGGFIERPVNPEVVPGENCAGVEACKPPVSEPPVEPFPASSAFSGAGNLVALPSSLVVKPGAKSLTRAQRLRLALTACARKRGRQQRVSCEHKARQRYGSKSRKKR